MEGEKWVVLVVEEMLLIFGRANMFKLSGG
jgi:hypothetical protein